LGREDIPLGVDIELLDVGEGLDNGGDCLDLLDGGFLTSLQLVCVDVMVMAGVGFSAIEDLFLDRVRE
jgi:hypothetical protein